MLRFLLDENLRGILRRAILLQHARSEAKLDVVAVGDLDEIPLGSADEQILNWCERHQRILVSLDRRTLPTQLEIHLQNGGSSPGIWLIRPSCRMTDVLDFLTLADQLSEPFEWQNRVAYIPD